MSDHTLNKLPGGYKGMAADMSSDQTAFKGVQWGKNYDVDFSTK